MSKHPEFIELDYIIEVVDKIKSMIEQGFDQTSETTFCSHVVRAAELLDEYLDDLYLYKEEYHKEMMEDREYHLWTK